MISNCVCHRCIREHNIKAGTGEDWFSQLPYSSTYMVHCPDCGNKRCPKASDHKLDCTGSNEPGQAGSVYQ